MCDDSKLVSLTLIPSQSKILFDKAMSLSSMLIFSASQKVSYEVKVSSAADDVMSQSESKATTTFRCETEATRNKKCMMSEVLKSVLYFLLDASNIPFHANE